MFLTTLSQQGFIRYHTHKKTTLKSWANFNTTGFKIKPTDYRDKNDKSPAQSLIHNVKKRECNALITSNSNFK